jgi:hypothetical protein
MDTMRFRGPGMLGSIASRETVRTEKAAQRVLFGFPSQIAGVNPTLSGRAIPQQWSRLPGKSCHGKVGGKLARGPEAQ